MNQTLAMFYGAYRRLNAKKMFWVVLILSALVVIVMAAVGIDEQGITVFSAHVWSFTTTEDISPAVFYKSLFTSFGIGIWLTWIAAVLALISTAGIFPDLITSGSIDLLLCRPISRVRLFLTQYLGGLLFVLLQVSLFTIASFLVIGIRGGAWEPALFLAVPIVLCFFSYLFAICVLFGVMTRSTLASLLLTLLVWFLLFIAGTVENGLSSVRIMATFENAALGEEIKALESRLERIEEDSRDRESIERDLSQKRNQLEDNRDTLDSIEGYARIFRTARNFLPKTSETVALLERMLIDLADLPRVEDDSPQMMIAKELRSRSAWWIIGTSLAFEAVILALGAWIFSRRDY